MSRDWTPRELHYFDNQHFKETGSHFYEREFVLTNVKTGEKTRIGCDDETKKRFPYLSFYFEDIENVKDENILCTFDRLEKELERIVTADNFESQSFFIESEYPFLVEWYNGQLDKGFYYREYNDELLYEKAENLTYPDREQEEYDR